MTGPAECVHGDPRGPYKCRECRRMTVHGVDPRTLYGHPRPASEPWRWADYMREAAGLPIRQERLL